MHHLHPLAGDLTGAAMPYSGGRRPSDFIVTKENAKKKPAFRPLPSAAATEPGDNFVRQRAAPITLQLRE